MERFCKGLFVVVGWSGNISYGKNDGNDERKEENNVTITTILSTKEIRRGIHRVIVDV